MAYSFLSPDNLFKRYNDAKKYTDQLTEPFPEFQRLARNRPHPSIDPAYPKTTDGTTASIVQKTPKRVVQQLPTGVVEADEADAWLPIVAQFLYTTKIIPYANEDYGLFEKSQLIIENGLTFGMGASYTPFLNHDGYFCPDMVLPYWGDIFLQRGKRSGQSCSYVFYRVWWQKADIQSLIASEKKLQAAATKRNDKYDATWDITSLQSVLDSATTKDQQAQTATDKERGINPEGIELITAFQKGVGAKFYTFCPTGDSASGNDVTIVRTKVNKDPRGKIPLDWFYGDIDGNNPMGRGVVELIGGLQNLIDSDMQMYQYNRALMLAPPVIKHGNMGNFKFAPNYVIETTDPTAKIEVLEIDTTAVANYPALYNLQKSQMLNLVNSPDTTISSDAGNPTFGKTPTALNQQAASLSVDDNAVRKRFETWFGCWSETAINLYFAERSGKEEIQLDSDTADKLRQLGEDEKFDLSLLNDQDQIMIDYDLDTPALKFRVDASTSKMKDEQNQLQAQLGLLEAIENNQLLQSVVPPEKIVGIYNSIVAASGVEDPEKLSIDIKQFKKQQEEAQAQAQQSQQPTEQPKGPSESLSLKDVVAVGAPLAGAAMLEQAGLPGDELRQIAAQPPQPILPAQAPTAPAAPADDTQPHDLQVVHDLTRLGLSAPAIAQALSMLKQGANEQQIIQSLQQPQMQGAM